MNGEFNIVSALYFNFTFYIFAITFITTHKKLVFR